MLKHGCGRAQWAGWPIRPRLDDREESTKPCHSSTTPTAQSFSKKSTGRSFLCSPTRTAKKWLSMATARSRPSLASMARLVGIWCVISAFASLVWRHMHCRQMARRVHCHMNLAATLAFVAVMARTRATLAAGLQCSPIHHHGAGLALASLCNTDDGAQVRRHCLEAAGIEPAPALLVDRLSRRQVIGQQPPWCTCPNQPAQSIEDFAQIMLKLWGVQVHQGEVRRREAPFFIADVGWVRLAEHHSTWATNRRERSS